MDNEYFIQEVELPIHRRWFKELQGKALEENPYWYKFDSNENKRIILCKRMMGGYRPIGYLMWIGKRSMIILKQIWIDNEFRRQGAGSYLFKTWHQNITAKRERKLWIDNINRPIMWLMVKIGYVTMENDKVVGMKFRLYDPPVIYPNNF